MKSFRNPPIWRRSQHCESGHCVEIAQIDGVFVMRNSKDPHGAVLTFSPAEWAAFTAGVRAGDFD